MYRLTVHVVEVMDLYDITAVLLEDSEGSGWARLATTHATETLADDDSQMDPFARILCAIGQWANSTIR